MKIKLEHLKSAYEIQDLQFIKLLDGDYTFDDLIQRARSTLGITSPQKNYSSSGFYKKVYKEAEKICSLYSLPNSWKHSMCELIAFDKFPTPGLGIYLNGETKSAEIGILNDLTITISQQTSFESILKWLESHRSVIQERLKQLPRKATQVDNFKLKLEVFNLYRNGTTPQKIEIILKKKYEDNLEVYDSLDREKIYHWIDDLKKLLQRKPLK